MDNRKILLNLKQKLSVSKDDKIEENPQKKIKKQSSNWKLLI